MTPKWDLRMMGLALHIATWSKDPSTKVGAVVAKSNRVKGTGFNGFPVNTLDDERLYDNRVVKYQRTVHAEANAVIDAGRSCYGATLYITMPPCSTCAGLIIQSGIVRVALQSGLPGYDVVAHESWAVGEALRMFTEARVRVDYL